MFLDLFRPRLQTAQFVSAIGTFFSFLHLKIVFFWKYILFCSPPFKGGGGACRTHNLDLLEAMIIYNNSKDPSGLDHLPCACRTDS